MGAGAAAVTRALFRARRRVSGSRCPCRVAHRCPSISVMASRSGQFIRAPTTVAPTWIDAAENACGVTDTAELSQCGVAFQMSPSAMIPPPISACAHSGRRRARGPCTQGPHLLIRICTTSSRKAYRQNLTLRQAGHAHLGKPAHSWGIAVGQLFPQTQTSPAAMSPPRKSAHTVFGPFNPIFCLVNGT